MHGRSHVRTEAERQVVCLWVNELQRQLATPEAGRDQERSPPTVSDRSWP
jgi:hypothetical protein